MRNIDFNNAVKLMGSAIYSFLGICAFFLGCVCGPACPTNTHAPGLEQGQKMHRQTHAPKHAHRRARSQPPNHWRPSAPAAAHAPMFRGPRFTRRCAVSRHTNRRVCMRVCGARAPPRGSFSVDVLGGGGGGGGGGRPRLRGGGGGGGGGGGACCAAHTCTVGRCARGGKQLTAPSCACMHGKQLHQPCCRHDSPRLRRQQRQRQRYSRAPGALGCAPKPLAVLAVIHLRAAAAPGGLLTAPLPRGCVRRFDCPHGMAKTRRRSTARRRLASGIECEPQRADAPHSIA